MTEINYQNEKKRLRVLIKLNELASIIVFQWRPRKAMLKKVKGAVNLIILLISRFEKHPIIFLYLGVI